MPLLLQQNDRKPVVNSVTVMLRYLSGLHFLFRWYPSNAKRVLEFSLYYQV